MTQSSNSLDHVAQSSSSSNALPRVAFILGLLFFFASNIFFALDREQFFQNDTSATAAYTSLMLIVAGSTFLSVAGFSYLSFQRRIRAVYGDKSVQFAWKIGRIVADAFYDNRRLMIISFLVYALIFSFLNGIVIYQPSVNFFQTYNVINGEWHVLTCCGGPGFVPVGLLFLPTQHAGLQLIPFSILLMFLISTLVSLNVSLLYKAFKVTRTMGGGPTKTRGTVGGAFGAAFGLFAGCPTCAAAFFISTIAGSGATAFSVLVAQYQSLIVAATVPLLLGSVFFQAKSIRAFLRGCAV